MAVEQRELEFLGFLNKAGVMLGLFSLVEHRIPDSQADTGSGYSAQLFSTNTFCHNILSTSTAIYSQSAENKDKFLYKLLSESRNIWKTPLE